MSDGTNVKLTFEGLIPDSATTAYYAHNYPYQGFNFESMWLITEAGIDYHDLSDTGFGSVLHGDAEMFTGSSNSGYSGFFHSLNNETFDLKSGIFASYKGTHETFFSGWNGKVSKSFHISLGESATTINFANYGNDFKHILRFSINTAGEYYSPTVMDNIKVHWNGPIPGSGAMKHHVHVSHPVLTAVGHQGQAGDPPSGDHGSASGADGHHDPGCHGELGSLVSLSHHGGGLTSEFSLPQAEHFGT